MQPSYAKIDFKAESLTTLMVQAARIRDGHWGKTVTYSRKVFVPLTNMCRDTCGYCTFVKHPDSPEATKAIFDAAIDRLRPGRMGGVLPRSR